MINFQKLLSKYKIIIVLCSIIVLLLFLLSFNWSIHHDNSNNVDLIFERLVNSNELTTVKYNYSNVLSIKDNLKFKDINIPFTERVIILKYDGHIKAGVDLDKGKIKIHGKTLTITLPNATILDNIINEEDIEVLNEKDTIFNPLQNQEVFNELSKCKAEKEKELINNGFLDDVNNETKAFIEDFFKNLDFDVKVVFHS